MENLTSFKKAICLQILITAAVVATFLTALGYFTAAKGLVLGSLFSLANFLVMSHLLLRRLGKTKRGASIEGGFSMLMRMVIMGAPIYIAYTKPDAYNLVWTIVGIFNLQASILIRSLIIERFFVFSPTNTKG